MKHTCSILLTKQAQNASCEECIAQSTIECTCPAGWFPAARREVLSKIAHNFGNGGLAHHRSCAKAQPRPEPVEESP